MFARMFETRCGHILVVSVGTDGGVDVAATHEWDGTVCRECNRAGRRRAAVTGGDGGR